MHTQAPSQADVASSVEEDGTYIKVTCPTCLRTLMNGIHVFKITCDTMCIYYGY